jgi:hypothetical protein
VAVALSSLVTASSGTFPRQLGMPAVMAVREGRQLLVHAPDTQPFAVDRLLQPSGISDLDLVLTLVLGGVLVALQLRRTQKRSRLARLSL